MKKIFFNHAVVLLGFLVFSTSLVSAQPALLVTPEEVDFGEVEAYSPTITTKEIVISNCGDGILCWGVTANDYWLTVEGDTSGEIDLPNGDDKYYQESLGACGLCVGKVEEGEIVGIYEGTFTIYQYDYDYSASPDPACTTNVIDSVTIAATMTISEFNILEVDPDNPSELDFGKVTEELTFDIKNAGEGNMEWEVLVPEGIDWLTVEGGTGASGTIDSGRKKSVTVRVDRTKVEGCVDEYGAVIKVTSTNATPDETTVNVIMEKAIEPPQPSSPSPTDGSTDQLLYSSLKWQEGASGGDVGGIVYFDVYFSTSQELVDSESPSVLVCDDLAAPYCDPSKGSGLLDANTTYYWKIKAVDECEGGVPSYGGPWSFTTGSAAVEPTCPVSLLLPLNDSEVTLLRRFRDEVLVGNLTGERYVDLYYSPHAFEALLILLFNPELRMCADKIVRESLPAIQSLLRGETALIDSEIRADLELFLEELEKDASPDLKKTIKIIRKDITTEDIFSDLKLFIVQ